MTENKSAWQGYGRPPPKDIPKLRFGFEREGQDRPVAWFEGRKGNIYWGSSAGHQFVIGNVESCGALTFEEPGDIGQIPVVSAHNSYHESGLRHLRVGDERTSARGWLPRPADLQEPTWLLSLTTLRADQYRVGRSMNRGGARVLRVPLDDETERCRFQFEFWLSPPGKFDIRPEWKYWIGAGHEPEGDIPMPQHLKTATITPELVLMVKYGPHDPGGLSDQFLDRELWFSAFGAPEQAAEQYPSGTEPE